MLVIDDDDLSREVLGLLLSEEGYAVRDVSSGDQALGEATADAADPDVILMDWQMPGISGKELAEGLRTRYGTRARLIAMSGSRPAQVLPGVVDAFLLKPFRVAELEEALRRMGEPREQEAPLPRALPGAETLDQQTFDGFKAMVDEVSLRELYRVCLDDAEKQVSAMRGAAAAGDDLGMRRSAHAIKGSLGMVGALELQEMCARLEAGGLDDDALATLGRFPAALERLRGKLIALGVVRMR